ncbi:MAG TPA: hypothetical protein VK968_10865 [Roseimicrobium sp.]|nr:hypothetical protein [Roseimicrobium sp.]
MKLSILATVLGLAYAAFQAWGLAQPKSFTDFVQRFSRNTAIGWVLMLLGTGWFIWNIRQEQVADFAKFKPYMYAGFAAAGVMTCIYVKDFLAVRGLAVVLLLLAKLMVDTGRPALYNTKWVLLFQLWAYVLVVAGIAYTIWPWKLRDYLAWSTATPGRLRIGNILKLVFGMLIITLGVTVF